MKRNFKIFIRTFCISLVISGCIAFLIYGIFAAYTSIRLIGFGDYTTPFSIDEEGVKILDFIIKKS